MRRVVIIGSAGRLSDAAKVNAQRFNWIVADIKETLIEEKLVAEDSKDWSTICLVSGGAAFVDHAAVVIAKEKQCSLHLCLPAPWNAEKNEFFDTGVADWRENPGGTSNHYHRQFSKRVGCQSLHDLAEMVPKSKIDVEMGFHARNSQIAGEADLLLAYTFSDNADLPGSSGTLHTWNKSVAKKKVHKSIF